ncbi:MAG: hypothetical protein QNJ09_05340 [Paracoccaceae bacterium]|nr:hypothetical protein [Paracoccaceae bacterium]
MPNIVENWAAGAERLKDFYGRNSFYRKPLITHTVSKSFEGGWKNDYAQSICMSPEECAHLHFPGKFDCDSLTSHDCDSEFSRQNITGALQAGYTATWGHAGDVGMKVDKKKPYLARGFFFGNFDILDKNGRPFTEGTCDGMCNVGVVRKPLEDACEKCHQEGRWHGSVKAQVVLPDREIAFLIGEMAFDFQYEFTSSWMSTKFIGTLEGMLIRYCKDDGKR